MTRTFAAIATLALVLASVPVAAQGVEPSVTLALDGLIQDAIAHSNPLRASRAQVDAARAMQTAARGAAFPRVSFSEGWQRGNQPAFVFSTLLASRRFAASNFAIDQLNHPGSLGAFHASAAIEQVLFDGGRVSAGTRRASAEATAAQLATTELELATIEQVTALYGQLVAVQATDAALTASLASAQADLQLAQRRKEAGTVTEADVLSLAVHDADLRQRQIETAGNAAILRAQLNLLTGAPVARTFAVAMPTPGAAGAPPLAELLAEAEATRPEWQRAGAARLAAEQGRREAHATLLPSIAAQAAFDVTGTRAFDRASSWIVGGEMRWSFGLGGTERAQLAAATARESQARAEADDARSRVHLEVITALRQLESARARQAVGAAMVAQAKESQRITRDRYEAGLARATDLLLVAAAVLDAEARHAAALADEFTSRARLTRATGHRP